MFSWNCFTDIYLKFDANLLSLECGHFLENGMDFVNKVIKPIKSASSGHVFMGDVSYAWLLF